MLIFPLVQSPKILDDTVGGDEIEETGGVPRSTYSWSTDDRDVMRSVILLEYVS